MPEAAPMPIFLLGTHLSFPSPHRARPDGLLAVGGDLSPERLILAYRMGIFPWFGPGEPILWWSPDPRLVLYPDELKVSRSLEKLIRRNRFQITFDRAFDEVIRECAITRLEAGEQTWITEEMVDAYCALHRAGHAHSVEAWREGALVGGLYGVSIGACFFGESMFSRESNASKVAFATLARRLAAWDFDLIDCQVTTEHLMRFGAREVERGVFLRQVKKGARREVGINYPELGQEEICSKTGMPTM